MKKFFKIFFLFLIAFPALCLADSEREDFPAVVKISIGPSQGTGTAFFIAPDKIVTNFHVISKAKNTEDLSVQTSSGKRYPIKAILALDAVNDLAVLEVKGYESEYYYLIDHSIDSVQEVEIAGFPSGKFQHSHGKNLTTNLKDADQQILFQKYMSGGASGSPVFKENKLIAVFKQHLEDSNMSTAASVKSLRELLSKASLHCQTGTCIEEEINRLHLLAYRGDDRAQFSLAIMYYHGLGVEQNFKKAFELLTQAVELGHPLAQLNLAFKYYKGEGVEQSPEQAFYWMKKSAEQEQILAQLNLAFMYYKGEGVEQSPEQAFYWMAKAAEQGQPTAQFYLAIMYYQGLGVEQNFNKAAELFTQAAEWGHPEAQFYLALMYYKGEGLKQNLELAAYWMAKAAEQGQPTAKDLLKEAF